MVDGSVDAEIQDWLRWRVLQRVQDWRFYQVCIAQNRHDDNAIHRQQTRVDADALEDFQVRQDLAAGCAAPAHAESLEEWVDLVLRLTTDRGGAQSESGEWAEGEGKGGV